ncbi:putative oxidoreductase [Paenibacillus algorifonticola]|uniref:Putative oxidoreductase n=1 Tax=Paenibacillus algorifonticola TaxID=684063 RepID=A0A1I1Z3F0_9BACL|nr:DoxX family protein [Paenibacillus algorifonticola]SFE25768.1 putative oxidoreductase [Paenibacillus algorifonticola]
MLDLGLLIIRLVIGLIMIGHGCKKLFGWFGGEGIQGASGFFELIGLRPGAIMVACAGIAELLGGLLFASGLSVVAGAILLIATMVVAIAKVHWSKGLWSVNGGFEYNLVMIAALLGVALAGAGAYSVSALM